MSYRSELIQVAAVAIAAVLDLDTGSTSQTGSDGIIPTLDIINEIGEERDRQETKWGTRHHSRIFWLAVLTEEVGEVARDILDHFNAEEKARERS